MAGIAAPLATPALPWNRKEGKRGEIIYGWCERVGCERTRVHHTTRCVTNRVPKRQPHVIDTPAILAEWGRMDRTHGAGVHPAPPWEWSGGEVDPRTGRWETAEPTDNKPAPARHRRVFDTHARAVD